MIEDYLSNVSGSTFFIALAVVGIVVFFVWVIREEKAVANMAPEERASYQAEKKARQEISRQEFLYGSLNPLLVCPHCQVKGLVRTKPITKKAGISGGKAAAAVLTGGLSVVATGLSRKEAVTRANCGNCGSGWEF